MYRGNIDTLGHHFMPGSLEFVFILEVD